MSREGGPSVRLHKQWHNAHDGVHCTIASAPLRAGMGCIGALWSSWLGWGRQREGGERRQWGRIIVVTLSGHIASHHLRWALSLSSSGQGRWREMARMHHHCHVNVIVMSSWHVASCSLRWASLLSSLGWGRWRREMEPEGDGKGLLSCWCWCCVVGVSCYIIIMRWERMMERGEHVVITIGMRKRVRVCCLPFS